MSTLFPDLKFDVAAPPGWAYAAGDTIIGNIVRYTPVVTPEATLKLVLTGRTMVKITESNGDSNITYSDQYELLSHTPDIIFRGPLHLPEDSQEPVSWPFAVKIPDEPSASCRKYHIQPASFLPLNEDHPAHHVFPGSFSSSSGLIGSTSNCRVEYTLKATLRYKFGSWKEHEATFHIKMRHTVVHTGQLREAKTMESMRMVQTQRLLPGMENAHLSFSEKALKFFGSSKVPQFVYKVNLTVPLVMQLDNPEPLQIVLKIDPLPHRTSDNIKDHTQQIRVNWIKLSIQNYTAVRAPGNFTHSCHSHSYGFSTDVGLESVFRKLESPLVISTGKGNEPVHIGNMFQLALSSGGLTAGKRRLTPIPQIQPSFTTYNIKHSHQQKWKVSVTVAGEEQTHEFLALLNVVAS
ncbi:hypothetical protein ASPWEDRAFT_22993 [Aspergillus wentii DTO 134E9]|uniref:Arrestin-like N-terminal domain-containing protein n=1 Tax=Aspergillus wentii DTO 134E9 TaxID=1073089 RepID=A0A1L9S158_ASPWE|nr:uncharacterized protein ASPWEDRAFT_22993 [Aspergillus wentii DTO 134E9]KAI9931144.1 hypothetical protein MW887_010801 [Aspergillus wentii]OJJ40853.1 hypothetical protein ASPWEDRAFT_22993 [Aspergillus wentii DTO 134E9]